MSRRNLTSCFSFRWVWISRVSCGGRNLTLVKTLPNEILPLVIRTLVALKQPYLHYNRKAA